VRALTLASSTPLSDFTLWTRRTNGLEIVLLISGAFIVSRASFSISHALTARIDLRIPATDELGRSTTVPNSTSSSNITTIAGTSSTTTSSP